MTVFLDSFPKRPLTDSAEGGQPFGLFVGNGDLAVEIVVFNFALAPKSTQLRKSWTDRRGGRAAPLLVIGLVNDDAYICGPSGEKPPIFGPLPTN